MPISEEKLAYFILSGSETKREKAITALRKETFKQLEEYFSVSRKTPEFIESAFKFGFEQLKIHVRLHYRLRVVIRRVVTTEGITTESSYTAERRRHWIRQRSTPAPLLEVFLSSAKGYGLKQTRFLTPPPKPRKKRLPRPRRRLTFETTNSPVTSKSESKRMEILNNLKFVPTDINYWFVRTDGGRYFDAFFENNYIGIGWNDISLTDLRSLSLLEAKEKIAKTQNIDQTLKKGKSEVTSIYNKLKKFDSLNKGDIIVIPSDSSTRLAFGQIDDNQAYPDIENTTSCPYHKRRRVKWLQIKHLSDLDPLFYEMKSNRHSISDINRYADYVDRVIYTYYVKDNYGHLVFEVNQKEDIKIKHLLGLVSEIHGLMKDINTYFDYKENIDDDIIKLNLQSKGRVAFVSEMGKTLAMLGTLVALHSCASSEGATPTQVKPKVEESIEAVKEFERANQEKLNKIDRLSKSLEIDSQPLIDTLLYVSNNGQ